MRGPDQTKIRGEKFCLFIIRYIYIYLRVAAAENNLDRVPFFQVTGK
jgi:hypothetical protein